MGGVVIGTPEPRASLRDAIDAKCRDCGAADGGAHWRMHVAVCTVTKCPLWHVRPLPKLAPHWLASRDPNDLPLDWVPKSIEMAIRSIGDTVTRSPGEAMASPDHEGHPDGDEPANTVQGGAQ